MSKNRIGVVIRTMEKVKFGKLNRKKLEEANDLCEKAYKIGNPGKVKSMLKKALSLSEYCSQAYTALALMDAKSRKEILEYEYLALLAEKKILGKEFFAENKGYFWGLLETRKYMFLKNAFTATLWEQGYREEAVKHALEMIELCPNDNLGIRYRLWGWLICQDDKKNFNKLIKNYPEDSYCGFYFDQSLFHFKYNNLDKAEEFLNLGIKQNKFVVEMLLEIREIEESENFYEYMVLGEESEASDYTVNNRESWEEVRGALTWLWKEYKKNGGKEGALFLESE